MKYRLVLVDLDRKIKKIENIDSNYTSNKRWIKYRHQQELIWATMRKENAIKEREERNSGR